VHYHVLAAHPELEVVQRPGPDENGVERLFPRNASESWWFRVKEGVKASAKSPRVRALQSSRYTFWLESDFSGL
jgi:hypothetical protein